MGKLTGTHHGDAANHLLGFYVEKGTQLEDAGQFFMAAIALALGVETALLAFLLVEFGDDNGGELQIPDDVGFAGLIEAANDIDVLRTPIDTPCHVRDDDQKPKHVANLTSAFFKADLFIYAGLGLFSVTMLLGLVPSFDRLHYFQGNPQRFIYFSMNGFGATSLRIFKTLPFAVSKTTVTT
jgi:hypothetical protein